MARTAKDSSAPTIIKKYANRRLYDTGRSSYVTLDDLREMIQEKIEFVVIDAKSGDDITRSVLAQIIAEQESQESEDNLLPLSFMKNLIGFYGDNIQAAVPDYLENTFDLFVKNQEMLREQMSKSLTDINPLNPMKNMNSMFGKNGNMPQTLDEMNRQNMAIFEKTMKMFSPFTKTDTPSDDKE